MGTSVDMLEVEAQLEAAAGPSSLPPMDCSQEAGLQSAAASSNGTASEDFYNSGKGSTWKKLKKMVKPKKDGSYEFGTKTGANHSAAGAPLPIDPTLGTISTGGHSQAGLAGDDTASEVAPSEYGRVGSRMSMRHDGGWDGSEDAGGSQKGTLKGMFKKQKKSKQIELDALRFEMGQLQERHDLTERDLATVRHDIGTLTAERDHLANQVHELTNALTLSRSDVSSAESEVLRLKELHSQVKAALQESYSTQQDQQRQVKELEELCAAQQNSLEEGEEKFRSLQDEQDQLHHTALAAKAQLVTAQAQLSDARSQREELVAELAGLSGQVAALQAEIDSRDEKMSGLEAAAEQANKGLESALARLRELEREQQQLEVRVNDLQEENLELSTELSGVTELRRQLEVQLSESATANNALSAQVSALQSALDRSQAAEGTLTARLSELNSQLVSSSLEGGSLKAQNGELLAELATLREQQQQQQQSKPSSPLSKWTKHHSSVPAAGKAGTTGSLPGASGPTPGISIPTGGSAGGLVGGGAGVGSSSVFSPMTSQLPAVRAGSLNSHTAAAAAGDLGTQQAPVSGDGTPSHPDSSCLVIAAGDSPPAATAVAATDTDSPRGPGLKPPVTSCSPDMVLAKGPLTASRPASRRPGAAAAAAAGKAGGHALSGDTGLLSPASGGLGPSGAAPGRKMSLGVGEAGGQGDIRPQRQPGDFFARMFGCFTPRTTEVM